MSVSIRRSSDLSQPSGFLALAHDLALAIGEADTLDDALGLVLRRVCESTGWELGQAWLPVPDGSRLQCSKSWFTSIEGIEPFRKVSELLSFPPGVGLPGRVWESGRSAWVEDVTENDNFPRSPTAKEVGLAAAMATPVVAEGEVAAVLEFFVRERQEEDGHLLDLIATLAAELGILVLRRRSEDALRASEERFRTVAETANDAILSTDQHGVVTYANTAAERIFGYSRDEFAGLPLSMLMPERYRQAHREGLSRHLETGEKRVIGRAAVELAGLRKDGTEFPLELSLGSWRSSDGEQFTGVIRDVSERVEAQAAILANEARLEEAQRLAHIGSWDWDIPKNRVTWSDELYRIYGLDPATFEATYEGFLANVHPDEREWVNSLIQEAFERRSSFVFDHRTVRPDGTERILHSRGAVYCGEDGDPIRMAGTAQDVTEQRKAEAELRKLDELKGRFIAHAAHELRSPLTVIVGMATILADNRDRMSQEDVTEGFESMRRQGQRVHELVNNLLDLSRLEEEESEAPQEIVDVRSVVERALTGAADSDGHRVGTDVAPDIEVRGDRERLERVLVNLLVNAYRYGGTNVSIAARRDGSDVVLSVEDDGPGVAPEVLPRLFEPFARGPFAADLGGSGLGLAITKRLVESLGGTITHRAVDPHGARFELRLTAA